MAEEETAVSTPEAPEAPPRSSRSSLIFKLGILLFVAVVVGAECLTAYFFLPTMASGAAVATASSAGPGHAAKADAAHGEKGAHGQKQPEKADDKHSGLHSDKGVQHTPVAELKELDLGEFTVTSTQPSSNSTLRITLHLFGTVAAADKERFQARMKETEHRFREQVIVTLRSAEVADLTDAGLGLLKRTILEKTNALLGEPLVKTVIFSEFSFFEM
jgi:flagellar FliL protein